MLPSSGSEASHDCGSGDGRDVAVHMQMRSERKARDAVIAINVVTRTIELRPVADRRICEQRDQRNADVCVRVGDATTSVK